MGLKSGEEAEATGLNNGGVNSTAMLNDVFGVKVPVDRQAEAAG